jgi:GntR family transcriptional regulator, vanillate catabolism transcriptional regulator
LPCAGLSSEKDYNHHRLDTKGVSAAMADVHARVDGKVRSQTRTEDLAEFIRQSLLDGVFVGGARINEVHLSRKLSVSRTPLRAALHMLAGERMLAYTPNKGFTVPEQSLSNIIEAYEMRSLAEGLAARLAAEQGLSEWMYKRLEESLRKGDDALSVELDPARQRTLYGVSNAEFHAAIQEAAHSQIVTDVIRLCHRVPQVSARNIVAFDLADVRQRHRAHRKIYEAIICREPREAEMLMRQHVLSVKLSLAKTFRGRDQSNSAEGVSAGSADSRLEGLILNPGRLLQSHRK